MNLNSRELSLLKKRQLNILEEFANACQLMGLNYTLSSGTLLGAVRHGGFIPWDDDIDVAMLREDYEEFTRKGQSHLPAHMFIQTYDSDPNYPLNFGKIRDLNTELKEYTTCKIDMKTGVYIDIFPVDRISSNKFIRMIDNWIITAAQTLKYSYTVEWAKKSRNSFVKMGRLILFPLARILGTARLNKLETLIRTKNNKKFNKLTYGDRYSLPPYQLRDSMTMSINLFTRYEHISFENKQFQVIKDKEKYLTVIYGNYMQLPPEEERVLRHDFLEINLNNGTKE